MCYLISIGRYKSPLSIFRKQYYFVHLHHNENVYDSPAPRQLYLLSHTFTLPLYSTRVFLVKLGFKVLRNRWPPPSVSAWTWRDNHKIQTLSHGGTHGVIALLCTGASWCLSIRTGGIPHVAVLGPEGTMTRSKHYHMVDPWHHHPAIMKHMPALELAGVWAWEQVASPCCSLVKPCLKVPRNRWPPPYGGA